MANGTALNILVVESSPEAAQRLCSMLAQQFGAAATCVGCATRGEALQLMSRGVNFLVANQHIADGDAMRLCQDLRADPNTADIPILLIGDYATAGEKIDAFLGGADDFVVRPIEDRLLVARINLLWRLKSLGSLRNYAPPAP